MKYIDLHCHPAMKPFGKSFAKDKTIKINSNRRNYRNSIWHYCAPKFLKKTLNKAIGLTKFTQADFTTAFYGEANVLCVSLYPLEKGFVKGHLEGKIDFLKNLVMGIGKSRIEYLRNMPDYFTDLEDEYDFYKQLDGVSENIKGNTVQYKLVKNYSEIDLDDEFTIHVLFSIEGAHVFNCGIKDGQYTANEKEVLTNVDKVKNWEHKPLFIGLAHHFYNELCGHAKSFGGIAEWSSNQKWGVDTCVTALGKKVIERLLDNKDRKRILLDIKHMSICSRNDYYNILEREYPNENIPIIVSHGAVNGLISSLNKKPDISFDCDLFNGGDINFYDNELVKICQTKGVFGIQLDERRTGSKNILKLSKRYGGGGSKIFKKAGLVWSQIEHIARVLNKNGLFAWGIQSVGSDFDGLIDPLNGFWTMEDMPKLEFYVKKHAINFIGSETYQGFEIVNQIEAEEITDRFIYLNALNLMKNHF